MNPIEPDADSAGLERVLSSFAPRPSQVDRDRLMYLAGQAVGAAAVSIETSPMEGVSLPDKRSGNWHTPWYWPVSTGVASVTAAILAIVLAIGPSASSTRESLPIAAPDTKHSASESPLAASPVPPKLESAAPQIAELSPEVAPSRQLARLSNHSALRLREIALRDGVDALPIAEPSGRSEEHPASYGDARRNMIERPNSFYWNFKY